MENRRGVRLEECREVRVRPPLGVRRVELRLWAPHAHSDHLPRPHRARTPGPSGRPKPDRVPTLRTRRRSAPPCPPPRSCSRPQAAARAFAGPWLRRPSRAPRRSQRSLAPLRTNANKQRLASAFPQRLSVPWEQNHPTRPHRKHCLDEPAGCGPAVSSGPCVTSWAPRLSNGS